MIGAVRPEALDRLDPDGTMDAYADMLGTLAGMLVPRPKAEAARQAWTQMQAGQAVLAGEAAPEDWQDGERDRCRRWAECSERDVTETGEG